MSDFRKCPFYRISASIAIGQGLGHCDLDASLTVCDGDMEFCEEPATLREYWGDHDNRKEMGAAKIVSLQRGNVCMKEGR